MTAQISVCSSKRIGMRTDASAKFEKGLDPENAQAAIDRACQLMEEFGAGEVVGGYDGCMPIRLVKEGSNLRPDRMNALLGTDLSREEMLSYLSVRVRAGSGFSDGRDGRADSSVRDVSAYSRYRRGSGQILRL